MHVVTGCVQVATLLFHIVISIDRRPLSHTYIAIPNSMRNSRRCNTVENVTCWLFLLCIHITTSHMPAGCEASKVMPTVVNLANKATCTLIRHTWAKANMLRDMQHSVPAHSLTQWAPTVDRILMNVTLPRQWYTLINSQ